MKRAPISLFALFVGLCFIYTPYVRAQTAQSSDNFASQNSDVSGTLVQSDQAAFQSDAVQARVGDAGVRLAQALQTGSLVVNDQAIPVSSLLSAVLTTREASLQSLVETWVARGMPAAEAQALAEAMVGLLEGGRTEADALVLAVDAFNAAVDASPASFLAQTPPEFVVVRAVLTELLAAAAE
jgi:hypothetical protein